MAPFSNSLKSHYCRYCHIFLRGIWTGCWKVECTKMYCLYFFESKFLLGKTLWRRNRWWGCVLLTLAEGRGRFTVLMASWLFTRCFFVTAVYCKSDMSVTGSEVSPEKLKVDQATALSSIAIPFSFLSIIMFVYLIDLTTLYVHALWRKGDDKGGCTRLDRRFCLFLFSTPETK